MWYSNRKKIQTLKKEIKKQDTEMRKMSSTKKHNKTWKTEAINESDK